MPATGSEGKMDQDRRYFLSAAALSLASTRLGLLEGAGRRMMATLALPAPTFGTPKRVQTDLLNIAYLETGPADGPAVLLLHGWPYDVNTYGEVATRLGAAGYRVIVPWLRGYGATEFRSSDTVRNGQQAAFAVDAIAMLDALKIRKAIVGGCDWGARTANILAALWPERFTGHVSVSGYLIGNPATAAVPLVPKAELLWWYQYYFATERGQAGYDKYRKEFARLIWELASPKWQFDDATFAASAASFENPDHVAIVIHNYRWRLGLAHGESRYDEIERRLAAGPSISVPTITLEGDANGAPHPDPSAYAARFTGRYEHRNLTGGIGHNLPQEAPDAFARAIRDLGGR